MIIQEAKIDAGEVPGNRILGLSLRVRQLEQVSRFYQEVVGLEVIEREPTMIMLGHGDRAFLTLLHYPDAVPDDRKTSGLYHAAFLLPSRLDLGRWLHHVSQIKYELDGAADHLVSEAVYLHDPEGNGVEIYADRPADAWDWDAGKVRMANGPLDAIGLIRSAAMDAPEPWTKAPAGMGIGHVHLRVGDAQAAARYYSDTLGLAVTREGPQASFMSWDGYHHHFAFNTWESAGAVQRDPNMSGLHSIALEVGQEASFGDPWGNCITSGKRK
jgi:catechol 2,3-dioxygenase